MGLQLEISLDRDIREIDAFLDELKFRALTLAARQALNRSAVDIRAFANKQIRKRQNLKLGDIKKRVRIIRARGMNIAQLEARVNFSGIPLPMILFIVGQKSPKAQTQPNPRRRSRSFQIVKGQKKKKPGLFIAPAQRGGRQFQVFRRKDPSDVTQGMRMQSIPSIAHFLRSNTALLNAIERKALGIMQRNYSRALQNQMSKLKF